MQLSLQIFEYQGNRVRTAGTTENPLFVASDVCRVLGIADAASACRALSDKQKGQHTVPTPGGPQKMLCVTESGLYKLIFVSRRPEAERFQDWVTDTVLPQLRKTGSFQLGGGRTTPKFVQRFNDNWDRVDPGYFSVIGELGIRLYGRLEKLGYTMPDKGAHGREMRPDVSVGRYFSEWLGIAHPEKCTRRKTYNHKLPSGNECEAYQYPLDTLPVFIEYVDKVWISEHAAHYLEDKDPVAIAFLPKLLPAAPMPPKAMENQFEKIKQNVKLIEKPEPPATDESAKRHFKMMRDILGNRPQLGEYLEDPEEVEE